MRVAGLLVAVLGLTLAAAVPMADANSHRHSPTVLRSGDDRSDEDSSGKDTGKGKSSHLRASILHRKEHRALAPVIAALKQALKELPAESDWQWACQGIVTQMESVRPHPGPTAAPAPQATGHDPQRAAPPSQ